GFVALRGTTGSQLPMDPVNVRPGERERADEEAVGKPEIAARMARTNGPFVAPEEVHALPGDLVGQHGIGEQAKESLGRGAAGQGDDAAPPALDRVPGGRAEALQGGAGELVWVRVFLDASDQRVHDRPPTDAPGSRHRRPPSSSRRTAPSGPQLPAA